MPNWALDRRVLGLQMLQFVAAKSERRAGLQDFDVEFGQFDQAAQP